MLLLSCYLRGDKSVIKESCFILIYSFVISEYDQEMPQSQTAEQPQQPEEETKTTY